MKKRSVFKHLPKEFVSNLLSGQIYCNSLQYFQKYDDDGVRRDSKEGVSVHKPSTGLQMNNLTTGSSFILEDWQFESSAIASQIYVFCMSLNMSDRLEKEFKSTACVEIYDVEKFCDLVTKNLPLGFSLPSTNRRLRVGHRVRYNDDSEPPGNRWALPELVAISKRKHYGWQEEFRLVFGKCGVFDFERVNLQVTKGEQSSQNPIETSPPITLQIGDISGLCKIHYFE